MFSRRIPTYAYTRVPTILGGTIGQNKVVSPVVKKLLFNEVTMRDGFQGIKSPIVTVKNKLRLLSVLSNTGYGYVEIGSFASPKIVPQMANTLDLIKKLDTIERNPFTTLGVLVLNESGLRTVIDNQTLFKQHNITVSLVTSPSDHFCSHNMKMNSQLATKFVTDAIKILMQVGLQNRIYISTCFSDQLNWISPDAVARVVDQIYPFANEIVLSDTFATATEDNVDALLDTITDRYGPDRLTMHFHEGNDSAMAHRNVLTSIAQGVRSFDGTISDNLGGCISFDKTHRNLDLISLFDKTLKCSNGLYTEMKNARDMLPSMFIIYDVE
jgi:hydroxymethylglutaryl-CoA lyase